MKDLLKKVKKLEIKTRRKVDSTFAGEYHSAFKGQGLEFDEVRLYQFGDDIRSIDWNVTAKSGDVYIKKFKEEREQTMFVLFDISGSEDFGRGDENKMQVGTEIAAIMAFSAMKNNDKIGLATFTDRIERFYAPRKGRGHVLAIMKGLMQHKMRSNQTNISSAVDWVKKTMKRRSLFIIISDFLDEGYETSLRHLSRKHEVILIRLFNKNEVMSAGAGMVPVFDAESGRQVWVNSGDGGFRKLVSRKFEELESNLSKLGKSHRIDFLTIDTTEDYVLSLEMFFRKRNARRKMA
ncbi:MAG: hypothetical protein RLZZ519_1753 [Bacteroidota bacterium]|jgi:uncharacterized protein (DUF58 family)